MFAEQLKQELAVESEHVLQEESQVSQVSAEEIYLWLFKSQKLHVFVAELKV